MGATPKSALCDGEQTAPRNNARNKSEVGQVREINSARPCAIEPKATHAGTCSPYGTRQSRPSSEVSLLYRM